MGIVRLIVVLMISSCGFAVNFVVAAPATGPVDVSERQVTFSGAGGVRLAGTLQMPSARFGDTRPAMVLLCGSGPTDRNGDQAPVIVTGLLKQIAEALADEGVVTVRFDKRGMYASGAGLPRDAGKYAEFYTWENFVGDAAGAYRFLREQARVDRSRVGIIGHSEGGLLALEAARALKSEGAAPATLVLLSTPGRPVDVVIAEQLDRILAHQGATPQQSKYFRDENARITRAIKQTGHVPGDVPAGLQALYPGYLGPFYKSELSLDPAKAAADFAGPVLVIAGSMDIQTSADRDAKALDRALSARARDDHKLLVVDHVSHNLKHVEKPTDPGFAGDVCPEVVREVKRWMAAKPAANQASSPPHVTSARPRSPG
jgi:pimeloyl-ACP methyl ester carboxylesterase